MSKKTVPEAITFDPIEEQLVAPKGFGIFDPLKARPLEAFTIERATNGWSMVTIIFHPNGTMGVTKTEPNLKAFAIADFKKAAFEYWNKID